MWYTTYLELHFQATRLQDTTLPKIPSARTGQTPSPDMHSSDIQAVVSKASCAYTRHLQQLEADGLRAGLFRFHSPLLTESLLVSFPPLTDMLKFSG